MSSRSLVASVACSFCTWILWGAVDEVLEMWKSITPSVLVGFCWSRCRCVALDVLFLTSMGSLVGSPSVVMISTSVLLAQQKLVNSLLTAYSSPVHDSTLEFELRMSSGDQQLVHPAFRCSPCSYNCRIGCSNAPNVLVYSKVSSSSLFVVFWQQQYSQPVWRGNSNCRNSTTAYPNRLKLGQ